MLHFTTLVRLKTKRNMKSKTTSSTPEMKQNEKVISLLEQLVAVEMYKGGATQDDIATAMGVSKGKVNGLVKGVKSPKENHG